MITVITITCREKAHLVTMAQALVGNLEALGGKDTIQWVVVDELVKDRRAAVAEAVGDAFELEHIPAPPSPHRAAGLPDHNRARNAGLAAARGSYVVLLDDDHIPCPSWLLGIATVAAAGLGFHSPYRGASSGDRDGMVQGLDRRGVLLPRQATAAAGPCWGASRAAFDKIGGFDEAYGGEYGYNDIDTCVRLERAGVNFVATGLSWVLRIRPPGSRDDVTADKKAQRGRRSRQLFNDLVRDRFRILPRTTS
ncbi:MAG: glycosyltransferase family 2 protein, partial [Thermoleophilia bacterium]|nr:glycosyltransferase family 2 protein [Thermoleophilia bacterium]